MRWLSRLTTVVALTVLVGGAAAVVWPRVRPPRVGGSFHTFGYFRDASGLPVGSRVVIAGVVVGEIESLAIEGGQARVGMRLRSDVALWDDAFATRKASSVLSDNYVELSPGGPDDADPDRASRPYRRLRSGEAIPQVIEAATTDRVLRGLARAIPRVEGSLAEAEAATDSAREWADGPLTRRLLELDRTLDDDVVGRRLATLDRASRSVDDATARIAAELATTLPAVDRGIDRVLDRSTVAVADLRASGATVGRDLAAVRSELDRVDDGVARAAELIDALGEERGGRLGQLIADPEPGERLAELAAAGAEAAAGLDRLKTVIGFRTEFNLLSRAPRFYVSAEIASRGDQFYLVELMKGSDGDVPQVELVTSPGAPARTVEVREAVRFTAQWGKRLGPAALRFGFRDSAIGLGLDVSLLRSRLKLSLDLVEPTLARLPRLKVAAAVEVFRSLYILGGIDDAMTQGGDLPISPWPADATVPVQFQRLRYGRDFFVGVNLTFREHDLNTLLRIYGGLVAALVR